MIDFHVRFARIPPRPRAAPGHATPAPVSRSARNPPPTILGTQSTMHDTSYGFTQNDNFTRIDIDKAGHMLMVSVFDKHGDPIPVAARGGPRRTRTSLRLRPGNGPARPGGRARLSTSPP